ncbi:hemerythrin domain-containing protein [Actinoplanes sp. NPDC051475]|uniref:hemerythrin domain-containing protein n=1 Tax=Actinoplanes sp. NPDC051475 TaxID=3157225 RepID=UPI00344ED6EE
MPHPRPDTNEMVIVHRVFRREFRLAPALVRGVAPGDARRSATVAAHCRWLTGALHHHHSDEDELLWPWLVAEAQPCAEVTARMQTQHEHAAALLAAADELLGPWAATADPATRDQLADVLERLHPVLEEHLDDEEATVLPPVAEHLTVAQWAELSRRGRRSMPLRKGLLFVVMMLQDATPGERAGLLHQMPSPVRLLIRWYARPAHRRYLTRLCASSGDPAPPPG